MSCACFIAVTNVGAEPINRQYVDALLTENLMITNTWLGLKRYVVVPVPSQSICTRTSAFLIRNDLISRAREQMQL